MIREILQEAGTVTTELIAYKPIREATLMRSECDGRLVLLHAPHSSAAEQYRRIASCIVSRYPAGGTLMITSPAPEDGKTLSAINLAFCLAERGPALLVDLDVRRCSVHRRLGLGPVSPGVEDALLEFVRPEDCLLSIQGTTLCVIFNRGKGHPMVDLMGAGRPRRFLDWALRKFRWVILDTPPAFPIADTLEIARHAMVGMLVVRSRKTPVRIAKQAIDALKGRLHFVVLNDSEAPSYAVYNKCYYYGQNEDIRSAK